MVISSINLDRKIEITYIDTKNQLADILTKGKFTRDERNHLLCLFNMSHFSSADCSEVMSKRTQKDACEEGVTANRDVLPSTASQSPGKNSCESQILLSSWTAQHLRTVRPVMCASSSDYSEWNIDEKWSSQEGKSDEVMEVRTGRLVYEQPPGLFT